MAYLDTILKGGVQSLGLVKTIGTNGCLPPYWDWAKNQLVEPTINFNNALKSPCQLETNLVKNMDQFNFVVQTHDVTLPPLTTTVVDIRWDRHYDGAFGMVFPAVGQTGPAAQAYRYKFYLEGEANCQSIPEGDRVYAPAEPNQRYYLVISNIDPTQT